MCIYVYIYTYLRIFQICYDHLDDALNSDDCKGSWNPKIDILIQCLSTTSLVVRHQTIPHPSWNPKIILSNKLTYSWNPHHMYVEFCRS